MKRTVGSYKLAIELELPPVAKRMHPVFHVSALRSYERSGNYQPPPLPDFVAGEPEWSVAFISDTRYSGSRRQHRVHWEGQQIHDGGSRCAAVLTALNVLPTSGPAQPDQS